MAKFPHGYRQSRAEARGRPVPADPPSALDFRETLLGSDAVARIVAEAAALAPAPGPEDLLVMWANAYYADPERGAVHLYQIGLYVAEDLRLNGKLLARPPGSYSGMT